jgi:hypothetical protein
VHSPKGPRKVANEAQHAPIPPVPIISERGVQRPKDPQKVPNEAQHPPTPIGPRHKERGAQHPIGPRQTPITDARHIPSPPIPKTAVMSVAHPVNITPNSAIINDNGSIFSSLYYFRCPYL